MVFCSFSSLHRKTTTKYSPFASSRPVKELLLLVERCERVEERRRASIELGEEERLLLGMSRGERRRRMRRRMPR